MIELQRAQIQAHQKNIERFRLLLATKLTHVERQHMHRRIAQEQAELERAQMRLRITGQRIPISHCDNANDV